MMTLLALFFNRPKNLKIRNPPFVCKAFVPFLK